MNGLSARRYDIVCVHNGVKVGEHDLSGVHLTVIDNHTSRRTGAQVFELDDHAGQLELTQYTGGEHYYLLPQDVDLVVTLRSA